MYDINDFDFQKDTIIETPLQLSKFLYNKVKRKDKTGLQKDLEEIKSLSPYVLRFYLFLLVVKFILIL